MDNKQLDSIKSIIYEKQKEYNEPGNTEIKYTDEEFDAMVNFYTDKTGEEISLIGSRPSERVVELPFPMPSTNKIKGKTAEKEFENFQKKYPGPIMVEDKLDGLSILLVYNSGNLKIYNRGDGINGQDISHIANFILVPKISTLVVRGELVLLKDDFKNLQETLITDNKMKKSRTLVNGVITQKNPDVAILSLCKFYAFEIISYPPLTPEEMFIQLEDYGFNVPFHKIIIPDNIETLNLILTQRKNEAIYDIDGLVLVTNTAQTYSSKNENPKYKIAYKIDTVAVTRVTDITWSASSRYGYLTPVISVEKTEILGSEITRVTGHNAKNILSRGIGIGAMIFLTLGGDIIPHIVDVIEPSSNIPLPLIPHHWNESNVEFVANDLSDPQFKIQEIYAFLNHLNVKLSGVATITKIYQNSSIQSVNAFLDMKPEQISHISGLGIVSATNICNEIANGIKNATYPKLMAATGFFGEGIGEKRFSEFINSFPDWKIINVTEEQILQIHGFGSNISKKIADALPKFKRWFWNSKFTFLEFMVPEKINRDLVGYTIVFSGFRDDRLKTDLENRGAKVPSSLVKNTNLLVVKSSQENTSKIMEATKKGIKILTKEELKIFLK